MNRTQSTAGLGALTAWSLASLGAGLAIGALAHASRAGGFTMLGDILSPLGSLWLSALQMTVLPLVVIYLLAAIVGARGGDSLGGLGARAIALFIAMLIGAALFTLLIVPVMIEAVAPAPGAMASLQATVPQAARDAAIAGSVSMGAWIGRLLPSNLFEAARRGDVLSLLLFSALLGLAIRRLPDEQTRPLARVFESLSAAMLVLVRWLLVVTPVGVFALAYALGRDTGLHGAGMLGGLVLVQCGAMLLFTLLIYPATALTGRVSLAAFTRALVPAQLIALSTRSSIAALPALIEGARDHLRLPAVATSFVLPLTISLFKVNRTISSTAKFLFLAHVYGVPVSAASITTFVATVIVLSFSSVGVPGGGAAFKTLPAYLAAGLPIQAIVIAEAVDTIPDIFKTVLNVTGDMSAATLLSRRSRVPVRLGEPAPQGMESAL